MRQLLQYVVAVLKCRKFHVFPCVATPTCNTMTVGIALGNGLPLPALPAASQIREGRFKDINYKTLTVYSAISLVKIISEFD